MSTFDLALEELRAQAKRLGASVASLYVLVDGRVEIGFTDDRGYWIGRVHADLDPESSDPAPNLALHAAYADWSGQ